MTCECPEEGHFSDCLDGPEYDGKWTEDHA